MGCSRKKPNPKDVVFTDPIVAIHIIKHFHPSGFLLDLCKGDGAFYNNFPADCKKAYCELSEGLDFFEWKTQVDWIISNPPYSVYYDFLEHAFAVCRNIVFLLPINKPFESLRNMALVNKYGSIQSMIAYGRGDGINFPFGYAIGAFYFERGNFKSSIIMTHPKMKENE